MEEERIGDISQHFVVTSGAVFPLDGATREELGLMLKKQEGDKNAGDGYLPSEHNDIGNKAYQNFISRVAVKADLVALARQAGKGEELSNFEFEDDLSLHPGVFVCMGGDFYGKPDVPIFEGKGSLVRKDRFEQAFNELWLATTTPAGRGKLEALVEKVENEKSVVYKALLEGKSPSIYLKAVAHGEDIYFGNISRYSILPGSFFYSEYIHLALNNFDHFGREAELAYLAGHLAAMTTAKNAHDIADPTQKFITLKKAFAQELFACHFLTDLFASGHKRTPRKELYQAISGKHHVGVVDARSLYHKTLAGYFSKVMHDEDNERGLLVKNSEMPPEFWKAYGDACYYERDHSDNRTAAEKAVAEGLQNVFNAFKAGIVNKDDKGALAYVPKVAEENHLPLFVAVQSDEKVTLEETDESITYSHHKEVVSEDGAEATREEASLTASSSSVHKEVPKPPKIFIRRDINDLKPQQFNPERPPMEHYRPLGSPIAEAVNLFLFKKRNVKLPTGQEVVLQEIPNQIPVGVSQEVVLQAVGFVEGESARPENKAGEVVAGALQEKLEAKRPAEGQPVPEEPTLFGQACSFYRDWKDLSKVKNVDQDSVQVKTARSGYSLCNIL